VEWIARPFVGLEEEAALVSAWAVLERGVRGFVELAGDLGERRGYSYS
jgi:hypothetical protein